MISNEWKAKKRKDFFSNSASGPLHIFLTISIFVFNYSALNFLFKQKYLLQGYTRAPIKPSFRFVVSKISSDRILNKIFALFFHSFYPFFLGDRFSSYKHHLNYFTLISNSYNVSLPDFAGSYKKPRKNIHVITINSIQTMKCD